MIPRFNKTPQGPIEVLLTDGHTRTSLAVARSLARHGISLAVLCQRPQSLAHYSRDVKYSLPAPEPAFRPGEFVDFVHEVVEKHEIRLVIPITDQALVLFERHRH